MSLRDLAFLVLGAVALAALDPAGAAPNSAPQVAYVSGGPGAAGLYLVRADGTGRGRLTGLPGETLAPAWSRDGQHLAFVHEREGASQVFVVEADGREPRRITQLPASHSSPSWSPDGETLAFVRITRNAPRTIYVGSARGAAQRRLAAGYAPAWSPDGRYIAFLSAQRGHPELYIIPPGGGAARRLETSVGGVIPGVTGFAWSPDGQRIAYASRSGPAQEDIRIIDVEDGSRQWLSSGYAPAWSPDGTRIAYTVSRVGSAYLAVTSTAGEGGLPLTDRRLISVRPAWSPDGRYIAFISLRDGDAGLYVIRPDGSRERRLDSVHTDFSRGPLFQWRP